MFIILLFCHCSMSMFILISGPILTIRSATYIRIQLIAVVLRSLSLDIVLRMAIQVSVLIWNTNRAILTQYLPYDKIKPFHFNHTVGGRCQAQYCAWHRPTTFHVWKTRGCQCSFRLLMMDDVSPETCWTLYKYGIINFWYIFASCWIFFMNYK